MNRRLKVLSFLIALPAFFACTNHQNTTDAECKNIVVDTIIKHDTVFYNSNDNWQEGFDLTYDPDIDSVWKKPVSFYIRNTKCSPIAIDFYRGEFRPGDNNSTDALLDLATTNDHQLRPFYRWCLNKTILIQDGALAESTGTPARRYAEKFPEEFFSYMDSDITGAKYNAWVSAVAYSGFYENENYKESQAIRKNMIEVMNRNCRSCTP